MNKILTYIILGLFSLFLSCNKKGGELKLPNEIEGELPGFISIYRYSVGNNDIPTTFIEVTLLGNGIKFNEATARDLKRFWSEKTSFALVKFYRVGKNLDKIDGYKLYMEKYPEKPLDSFLESIRVDFDQNSSELRLEQTDIDKEQNIRISDISSIKVGKDEDCLFVTLKTPLRDEDKSPATYKLKSVKKSLVKSLKF